MASNKLLKDTMIKEIEVYGFVFFIDNNDGIDVFQHTNYLENPKKYIEKLEEREVKGLIEFFIKYAKKTEETLTDVIPLLKIGIQNFYQHNWYNEKIPKQMDILLKKSKPFQSWHRSMEKKKIKSEDFILKDLFHWPQDSIMKKTTKIENIQNKSQKKSHKKKVKKEEVEEIEEEKEKEKEIKLSNIEVRLLQTLNNYPHDKYIHLKSEIMANIHLESIDVFPDPSETCSLNIIWDHALFNTPSSFVYQIATFLDVLYAYIFTLKGEDVLSIFLLSFRNRNLFYYGKMILTLFDPESHLDRVPIARQHVIRSQIRRIKCYFDVEILHNTRNHRMIYDETFNIVEKKLLKHKGKRTLSNEEKAIFDIQSNTYVDHFVLLEMAWISIINEKLENNTPRTIKNLEMFIQMNEK